MHRVWLGNRLSVKRRVFAIGTAHPVSQARAAAGRKHLLEYRDLSIFLHGHDCRSVHTPICILSRLLDLVMEDIPSCRPVEIISDAWFYIGHAMGFNQARCCRPVHRWCRGPCHSGRTGFRVPLTLMNPVHTCRCCKTLSSRVYRLEERGTRDWTYTGRDGMEIWVGLPPLSHFDVRQTV